ncbi:hypothetical protein MGAD_00290 [Mycolicibacterium gadium]|uniref:Uncharacterized protein n=1 Tax=Mycolicibacterium gadium TaxID=1794 RepID=A0A7I7WE45_MYCGU|nr:hypothetical protein MGAD_00290 [Mycolicibacterium gadium]
MTSLLADDPNKVGQAVEDLNAVVADVQDFAADNTEAIGTASDKMTSITRVLVESLDDIKQTLHIAPTVLQNYNNIYEPANGSLTGARPSTTSRTRSRSCAVQFSPHPAAVVSNRRSCVRSIWRPS